MNTDFVDLVLGWVLGVVVFRTQMNADECR
jgi:hypothetical protein